MRIGAYSVSFGVRNTVQGSRRRRQDLGLRVSGIDLGFQGLWFVVEGLELRV